MRMIALVPLAMLAACNVSTDSRNNSATVQFNDTGIDNAADAVANDAALHAAVAASVKSLPTSAILSKARASASRMPSTM